MADDLAALEGQLLELRRAYRSGILRVTYDGKAVEYRHAAGMREAIAALEFEIAKMQGLTISRIAVVRSQKGW